MTAARPLHLHTVESVCADLVAGRPIIVDETNKTFTLEQESSRAVLSWYFKNRAKWAGNVNSPDAEAIVDAAKKKPVAIAETVSSVKQEKRLLALAKVEAHRFGGLHAYSDGGRTPETFVFEPTRAITLLEGWNGSGKTSIVNAVIWCLTGQLLRPQRKPEEASEEFSCTIQLDDSSKVTEHKLTPASPLPDRRYLPDVNVEKLPLDTWVELTFVDEKGELLAPIRRVLTRTVRGAVSEIPADVSSLGIDPISAQIGTVIPGLLPFIQIGAVSEFGQAIAQLTGLADLVDLAKHATKVKQRLEKEFTKARREEIEQQDEAFCVARSELESLITLTPSLKPVNDLPTLSAGEKLEEQLTAVEEHFVSCKTLALENARQVLGADFDPSNKVARDNLENSVLPALEELKNFAKLPSASRLVKLSNLGDEKIIEVENLIGQILDEANTLAELKATPDLSKRRQLYARVAAWMKDQKETDLLNCKVCGGSLENAIDSKTGILVREELSAALSTDSDVIGLTVKAWAENRFGALSSGIPEELAAEIRKELPAEPSALLMSAIAVELFESSPFLGELAVLKPSARNLAASSIASLPKFVDEKVEGVPVSILNDAKKLDTAIWRIRRAINFGRWQNENKAAINSAVMSVTRRKSRDDEPPISEGTPLGIKLVALSETVKSAEPINASLQQCVRMAKALKNRREKEKRIEEYVIASSGLGDLIAVGALAQAQVESLRMSLDGRAAFWRDQIYRNAYTTSGYGLVGSDMDSKGSLSLFVGSNGVTAPAQHVSNASALRASLVGFFLAFWEYVLNERGGLKLLILDDPQELFDDQNRDRLARTLPKMVKIGAQLVVTTHNSSFARMSVAEARNGDLIEHRSVHPVNANRAKVNTAPAFEELDRKRALFEKNIDDAAKAQDYVDDVRVFIEQRLADFFDDPAYPAYAISSRLMTFSDYLGRLRALVDKPPNELFRRKPIVDFCGAPALKDGASCLALLNKAHHRDKSKISYKDVADEADNLKRLRGLIEGAHEEFRRWKWRDSSSIPSNISKLESANSPIFSVPIIPDLAAFSGMPGKGESQDVVSEVFDSKWFEDKSFFYLRTENMGFAAPATSIAVVESESGAGNDRDLVIAFHKGEILARRLLRPQGDVIALALAAQTPDPRKSPPTRMLIPDETQIHKVRGVLFVDVPPPTGKQEAIQIFDAPSLRKVTTSYRVRDESALPLALPGQIVLGGDVVLPADLGSYEGRFVALTLTDGSSIFKRVGPVLSGIASLRQFESIGGLGASEVIVTEDVDGKYANLRVMQFARQILGVIYV